MREDDLRVGAKEVAEGERFGIGVGLMGLGFLQLRLCRECPKGMMIAAGVDGK